MHRPPAKEIEYDLIRQAILDIPKRSHKALCAYDFAFGCRVGELAREYKHKYKSTPDELERGESEYRIDLVPGPKFSDIHFLSDKEGETAFFNKPNFKQKQEKFKQMKGVLFEGDREQWLFDIVKEWAKLDDNGNPRNTPDDPLFPWNEKQMRSIIKKEMRRFGIASHSLRHSRATFYAEITGNPYQVKALLGHADIRTSMTYVHTNIKGLRRAING